MLRTPFIDIVAKFAVSGGIALMVYTAVAFWLGFSGIAAPAAAGVLLVGTVLSFYNNQLSVGHGVDGKLLIMGMPTTHFVPYMLGLLLSIQTISEAGYDPGGAAGRLLQVRFLIVVGVVAIAVFDWYLISSPRTFYSTEERERLILKGQNLSDEQITARLERYRRQGRFGPRQETEQD